MHEKKPHTFRLSPQTVSFLDKIKEHLQTTRPRPYWGGCDSRTSALEYAAQQVATRIETEAREKLANEKSPKPTRTKPTKKGKAKT